MLFLFKYYKQLIMYLLFNFLENSDYDKCIYKALLYML